MSTKPLWYRWARVYLAGGLIIGTGVLLYNTIRPSEEDLIASFSPEVRREYERNKELRELEQQKLMEIVKKTAESNEPIWKTGPIGSPFEKHQRNLGQQLVDYEGIRRDQALNESKQEVEKAKAEALEAESLISGGTKSKWWWK
ncbi:Assembly factor CBP4 [Spathaspora sp. JA1]|nr:Assembly factor CBP4 [Spathaspora sp. JA1]